MNLLNRIPIRYQLQLIVMIMALPVIGLILNAGLQERKTAMNVARMDTQKLADSIAFEQQSRNASARQLMVALAQIPEIKQKDAARVTDILGKIHKLNPDISNIFIADRSGTVWATAVPVKPPFIVSDRRYFKNALASGQLSTGEYVVSRAINRPTFNLSYPIKDQQGEISGVISVGFLLEKYTQILERSKLPSNASFALLDHKGVILFRGVEPEKYIGKPTESALFKQIQAGPDEDTSFGVSVASGDARIITTRKLRLDGETSPYMYIRAGIPVEAVFLNANSQLFRNLLYAGLILLASYLFASFIGKRSIVVRLELLEKTSQSLAEGDLKTNISEIVTGGELGRLALSFDSMAHKLHLREQTLFETRERLRGFIGNAPVILFALDKNGLFTFSDGKGLEALGLTPGQVIGQSAFDLYKDSASALEGIRRALRGESCNIETTVGDKVFEVWYSPLRNSQGEFDGVIGVAADITERKKFEVALLESEDLLAEIIEQSPISMAIVRMDGTLERINRRAIETFGYFLDDIPVLERWWVQAYPDASYREEVMLQWAGLVDKAISEKREIERREYLVTCKDGTVKTTVIFGIPVADRIFVLFDDITDIKRAEEARINFEKQLLHAQKLESLGILAGGIAHDFNNILTSIVGNADLALMRMNPESPAIDNLHKIEHAAARAADLAKQMLAYSGKGQFVIKHLDMNLILQEMLHMLEVSISKKVELRLNLTPNLPAVEADATQIQQIIMNLVINASEAIGDMNGSITINTGFMECDKKYLKSFWQDKDIRVGQYVYLEITDTGCGMDKDTLDRIFDPFFTTKFTGRGLGMAAVHGIIRGHKGAINVYSEPNKGTSFKVFLPASGKPFEIPNHDSYKDDWKGEGKVLLVDDEEIIRDIGQAMLQEFGFSVITANDGQEALDVFKSTPDIAFVILDLTMPHMDGEQCFKKLQQIKPDVKIIISSGFSEYEVTQKFVGMGLAGFVQKPYKLGVLKDAIRLILYHSCKSSEIPLSVPPAKTER